MARRHAALKRQVLPDPKYGSEMISKFINMLMLDVKKSVAEPHNFQILLDETEHDTEFTAAI